MMSGRPFLVRTPRLSAAAALGAALVLLFPADARASLLSPELEDKLANFLALFVIFIVPIVLIVLFWLVHILPEKIAHNRHHPQFEAIRTLCLLSLVFGGLLWPIAWIWAYSKPALYKLAYGTDTVAHGPSGHEPAVVETVSLHDRVARLEGRVPAAELDLLRADLAAIEAKFVEPETR
jgi:heme/copper-type cytochrome/quinol oxidase subunit 2